MIRDEIAVIIILVLILVDLEHEVLEGDVVLHGFALLLIVHGGGVHLALLQDLHHSLVAKYQLTSRLSLTCQTCHLGVELSSSPSGHCPLVNFLTL